MLQRISARAANILRKMTPPQIIAVMFLTIILVGAAILTLPVSSAAGTPTGFLTCLFTATSATCVTGLSVVETGLHWSIFGQWVILLLIQIGGLGFMSIAAVFYIVLRRRIGLKKRMVLAQALSMDSMSGGAAGAQRRSRHACGRGKRSGFADGVLSAPVPVLDGAAMRRVPCGFRILQRRL